MKFGDDVVTEIKSSIGVRQGSCEGPILFLLVMQAVLETIKWPDEIVKPSFMTALSNGKLKERINRRQDVEPYEFWSSLYVHFMLMTSLYSLRSVLILTWVLSIW
jgi:hypothetical protein